MTETITTSPVAVTGTITLVVAVVIAAVAAALGIIGNARQNARQVAASVWALHLFTAVVGFSAALIIYAFVTHDFSIKYVAGTSDVAMPLSYKITAFWGGLDGSLLFWVVVLALFSSVAVAMNARKHRDMIGYVVATIMVVQLFFLLLQIFGKNPFGTFLTRAPEDGQGLNPLLQNYWMVIHPPSLYIGFVAATIPFAFGIAALASGRLDDMWLGSVRVWMLICFFFLSFGLILGGRWAYEELGWGGYWAWDPVENAGFLPWFTATAFLHSAIIQEQRGMLKGWNIALVIMTFFLTIWGTFMTRAGVVQSVHSFGEDNELAVYFLVFMLAFLVVALGLTFYRAPRLRSTGVFESLLSREFAFLLNNWILLVGAVFVLVATMFPTVSEAIDGERVNVLPPFFNRWMTPIGLILLFLAGAAPLMAWRRTSAKAALPQFIWPLSMAAVVTILLISFVPQLRATTPIFAKHFELPVPAATVYLILFTTFSIGQEIVRGVIVRRKQTGSDPFTSLIGLFLSKRRKYGGYVVHLGIAVLYLGFLGKTYESMTDTTVVRPAQVVAMSEAEYAAAKATHVALGRQDDPARGRIVRAVAKADPAWYHFRDYHFLYEGFAIKSDDHRTENTARVSVWEDDTLVRADAWTTRDAATEHLATLFPARFDYAKSEQPTTEVDIKVRFSEDVYLVLTGFEERPGQPVLVNLRTYVNPLINFVWAGFVMLAIGVFICLIPERLVRLVSPAPRSMLGRATDVVVFLLVVGSILAIPAKVALAQPAEHEDVRKVRAGHNDGGGDAHKFRPDSPTASALMKELVCMCGGCARENLYECKCGFAAQEREKVLTMLAAHDLSSQAGRDRAYQAVIGAFIKAYGGEDVLANPRSKSSWLIPVIGGVGGLGLLFFVASRWVRQGRAAIQTGTAVAPADQALADRLDDELRDTD